MKKIFLITIFVSLVLFSFISAQPSTQINYTISPNSQGVAVTQLNYQPYPVNPGEYFDLWVEAQFYGSGYPSNATFILQPQYPFSLDPTANPMQSFGNVVSATPLLLHYRIKVDPNAVQGDNYLDLVYSSDGGNSVSVVKQFDIQVSNAQTDFDLVIQDYSTSATSIGIANIGENTANSLIVKIPTNQTSFIVSGTNGQIVGNLNSGDYTIATFNLIPVGRSTNRTLDVELDYTDSIGVRRTIIKDIPFNFISSSINSTYGGGMGYGNFSGVRIQRQSIVDNTWFWVAISAVIITISIVIFAKFRKKKQQKKDSDHSKRILDHIKVKNQEKKDSKEPDWVVSERTKKK